MKYQSDILISQLIRQDSLRFDPMFLYSKNLESDQEKILGVLEFYKNKSFMCIRTLLR